jgi:polysaccharide export outer membrane protein
MVVDSEIHRGESFEMTFLQTKNAVVWLAGIFLILSTTGCHFGRWTILPFASTSEGVAKVIDLPREKNKAILPEYRIEPPDVLSITAIRLVPKAPYKLQVGDTVVIQVVGTVPDAPINGEFPVQIGGVINLGYSYGKMPVRDLTVEEAQEAIREHLLDHLRDPLVTLALGNIAASQQITGPRLVAQDGRVNLGVYGTVSVTGLTLGEAKRKVEEHLSEFLDSPQIAIDVQNYNSKFYYLIFQGAGTGDTVRRIAVSGNETVLDAIASQGNIPANNNQYQIWIARPGLDRKGHEQMLLVDWRAITQLAETDTNYQILPGDRLYISEKKMVRIDNDFRNATRPLYTMGQFVNFFLGSARNLNFGLGGAAPTSFQNLGTGIGGGGGGTGIPIIPTN